MNADANRRLENIVRFGTVKTINPSKPIPRVIVNLGDIETPEIRCLNIRSGDDATWDMPSINEECVVISPCGDIGPTSFVLYGFYNDGNIRMAVTDEEVVESWKRFFDRGTNWKDFPQVTSYEEYRRITDKQHLSKAKSMPIKFLKASGKGFFIDKDGYALGIRDELADVIKVDAFKKQMKDIIEYRTMEYYRRRYVEK